MPWELGLAETQQTLVLNELRDRIVVQVDGQLKTGRDVVIGALLGAEEFGFATAPLVVMGCVMMRVCHLDTCPVGVATQNPELRKRFAGKPEFVENFFRFIAEEVREYMAKLGFRTIDEMIGRVDRLDVEPALDHWKARGLDFSAILHRPRGRSPRSRSARCAGRITAWTKSLDRTVLDPGLSRRRWSAGERVSLRLPIRNVNRTVGTMLGYEVTRRYGAAGLPDDTIRLHFTGSAGQSFGAFMPRGITLTLEGDANDYLGKGLSGGRIIAVPPRGSTFVAGGEHHRRQRGPVRRDLRARPSSGASRESASPCATAAPCAVVEGRGRPRLRVHDRRPRGGPGADGAELRRGHERRDRLRSGRGGGLRTPVQQRDGGPRAAGLAGRPGAGAGPHPEARRIHAEHPGQRRSWRTGITCTSSS